MPLNSRKYQTLNTPSRSLPLEGEGCESLDACILAETGWGCSIFQRKTFSSKKSQAGNVFVLILAGVFLFGALMFTFSRSADKGSGNLTKQQAKIAAQEILNYARLVEGAVDRVRRNGCSENEISFDNAVVSGYSNTNSPGDNSCHIFEPEGGKIEYTQPEEKWLDSSFSAQTYYQHLFFAGEARITDVGTTNTELLFSIFYLNKDICEAINNQLNISNPPGSDNADSGPFAGSYTPSAVPEVGDEATALAGQQTFCFFLSVPSAYMFVHTLIAR